MLIYSLTIFVSAFLLFQIQPMIAKMILPWFGGSAAVWITCMLFFQTGLLGGYVYAHWLVRSLKPKTQMILHSFLLAASLLVLPVAPSLSWKPAGSEDPILRILGLLGVSVGLPYFLLSTTSPLLQAWYSRTYKAALPYRLFALSNFASLLGLLAYPFLVEPNIPIRQQSVGWSAAYAGFVLFGIVAAWIGRRVTVEDICSLPTAAQETTECRPPSWREKLLWLLFAACASTMLLAVTNHLTQNVASIPFLWILPLGLYLLTFIICFDYERLYNRSLFLWLTAAALGLMSYGLVNWNARANLMMVIPSFSAGLFVCCLFCHGELVRRKPAPRFLTSFYIMLSAGGALGGVIVGLAAPTLFSGYYELPLVLICSGLLLFTTHLKGRWFMKGTAGLLAIGVAVASGYYVYSYQRSVRVMARNFYGMLRVNEYNRGTDSESRDLVHGTITHGVQYLAPEWRGQPVTYYGRESGIGLAMRHMRKASMRVGIIGLGAGTIAAYAEPGDIFRFYEINPLVVRLARSEFTYLADSRGKMQIVPGDARLSLEQEPVQNYDILAVDAFSGDSIPAHLLTTQALELYFRHLKPGGVLALHISNAHLNLEPVVAGLGSALARHSVLIVNQEDEEKAVYGADWVLLTSDPLVSSEIKAASSELNSRPDLRVWTDDYNNLFSILRKKPF